MRSNLSTGAEAPSRQVRRAVARQRTRRGLGELTVYETSGRWVAPVRRTGQRPLKIYGATEEEAFANRDAYRLEVAQGMRDSSGERALVDGKKLVYLGEWLDYWLHHIVQPVYNAAGKLVEGRQPTTFNNYRWHCERNILPKLGRIKLADLQMHHVRDWYRDLLNAGVAESSAYEARRVLVTALTYAMDNRALTGVMHNAASEFKKKAPRPKEKPAPDPAALARIFEVASGDLWELVIHLGVGAGLRRQEIAALQWRDFDLERGEILIRRRVNRLRGQGITARGGSKMNADDVIERVPIDSAEWTGLLQAHRVRVLEFYARHRDSWTGSDPRADSGWLFFCTAGKRTGGATDPNMLYRWCKQVFAKAGVPSKTMHGLRHDFAGILADSNVPLIEISRALRHKNIAVTDAIYTHLTEERKRTVVGKTAQWIAQARVLPADGATG